MSEATNKRISEKLNWLHTQICSIDASHNVKRMNTIMQDWVPVLFRLLLVCTKLSRGKQKSQA
jgi:hypothetical protein